MIRNLAKLVLLLLLAPLARAQVTLNGATVVAGGNPSPAVSSVNGNPGALVLEQGGSTTVCTFASGTTTCNFTNSGSSGFPITLGGTSITANSTTTAVTGLSVNGVSLTAAGSAALYLNQQGGYTAPAGGGSGVVDAGLQYALTGYPNSGSNAVVGPAPNLWELSPSMTSAQITTLFASLTPGLDVVVIPPSVGQISFSNPNYVTVWDTRGGAVNVQVGGAGVACDANNQSTVTVTSGSNQVTVGSDPSAVAGHSMSIGYRSGYGYGATQATWFPTINSVTGGMATMSSNAPFTTTNRVVFGTDNTANLQQIVNDVGAAYPIWIPNGCLMLTGPIQWNNAQSFIGNQMAHNGFVSKPAYDILQQPDSSSGGNVSGDGVRIENMGFTLDSPIDPTVGPITDYAADGTSSVRAPLYRPAHMAPEAQDANSPLAPAWMTNATNGVATIAQNSAVICTPNAYTPPAVGRVIVFPYQTAVFTSTVSSTAGSCPAGFTARTMAAAFPNTSGYTVAQAEWFAGTAVQSTMTTIPANPTLPFTITTTLPMTPVPGFESNGASHGHIRFGNSECDYMGNGSYGNQIVLRRCNTIAGYSGTTTIVPVNPCAARNQFYAATDTPWPVTPTINSGDSTPSGATYFPGLCVGAAAISFPQANGNTWAGTGLGKAFLEHLDFNGDAETPQDAYSTAAIYMAGNTASYGTDFGGLNVNYYQYGIVQGPASYGMHGVAAVGPTGDANTYHDISIHAGYPLTFDDLQNSSLDRIDTYGQEFSPYDGTSVGPGTCVHFGYTLDEQTGVGGITSTSVNTLSNWECEPETGSNAEVPVYAQLDQYYSTYTSDNFEGSFTIVGGTGNTFLSDPMHTPLIDYGASNHFISIANLNQPYITNTWPNGFMEWGISADCSASSGQYSIGPALPCAPGTTQPVSGRSIEASVEGARFENPQGGIISPGEWNTNVTLDANPMAVSNVIDTTELFVGRYAGCNLGGANLCQVTEFDGFNGFIVIAPNGRLSDTSYDISADFKSAAASGQFTLTIAVKDPGTGTCTGGSAVLGNYTVTTATAWTTWQSPIPVNFSGYVGCAVSITMNGATTTDQYRVGKFDFVPVPNQVLLPLAAPTVGNPCSGPNAIIGVNSAGPVSCYNGTIVQSSGSGGGSFPVPTPYSGSVTYAAGAIAYDGSGNNYSSLSAGNVGNALTNTTYWHFLGGVSSTITGGNCVTAGQFVTGISTVGVPTCATPGNSLAAGYQALYLPFQQNTTTATTLTDYSTNAYNGTFGTGGNAPTWLSSGAGIACTANQYIVIPPGVLNGAETIQMWFALSNPQYNDVANVGPEIMLSDSANNNIATEGAYNGQVFMAAGAQQPNVRGTDRYVNNSGLAITYNGTTFLQYIDGRPVSGYLPAVSGAGSITFNGSGNGNICNLAANAGYGASMTFYGMAVYPTVLTPAQIANNDATFKALIKSATGTSFPTFQPPSVWVVNGDSRIIDYQEYGLINSTPYLTLHSIGLDNYNDLGVGAQTQATAYSSLSTREYPLFDGNTTGVRIAWNESGTNDIAGGASAATLITSLQNYCSALHTRYPGIKVVVNTPPPRSDVASSIETVRETLVSTLVSDWLGGTLGCDGLADEGEDMLAVNSTSPNPFTTSSAYNSTYYRDGIHYQPVLAKELASQDVCSVEDVVGKMYQPCWIHKIIPYTAVAEYGANATKLATFLQLGPNWQVCGVKENITTAFVGTSITGLTLSVGDSTGTTSQYMNSLSLLATGTALNLAPNYNSATGVVQGTFTATGGNLSALTAGSINLDICVVDVP